MNHNQCKLQSKYSDIWGKVMFSRVSHSVHRDGGGLSSGGPQRPPDRDNLDRDPLDRDRLDRDPLDRDPCMVKSWRYASHWNAFLFI